MKGCGWGVLFVLLACASLPLSLWWVADSAAAVRASAPSSAHASWYQEADWWVAIFTFGLVAVTACLAAYTYRLWSATARLVQEGDTTNKQQLRAYIGHMSQSPGAHFESRLVIKNATLLVAEDTGPVKYFDWNYGRTPAMGVKMFVKIVDKTPASLDDTLTEADRQQVVQIVHPGQNIGRQVGTQTRDDTFFLYGLVEYVDIFGGRWRHRFAFDYNADRRKKGAEGWEAHHQHNDEQRWDCASRKWVDCLATAARADG